jgi:hypothetical protein
MIPKSGDRFSEKIMLNPGWNDPGRRTVSVLRTIASPIWSIP